LRKWRWGPSADPGTKSDERPEKMSVNKGNNHDCLLKKRSSKRAISTKRNPKYHALQTPGKERGLVYKGRAPCVGGFQIELSGVIYENLAKTSSRNDKRKTVKKRSCHQEKKLEGTIPAKTSYKRDSVLKLSIRAAETNEKKNFNRPKKTMGTEQPHSMEYTE